MSQKVKFANSSKISTNKANSNFSNRNRYMSLEVYTYILETTV